MSVELTWREDIAVITLNRPDALNALNADMIEGIGWALDKVVDSPARALLIVGAGSKAFCAGADVKELQGKDRASLHAIARNGQLTFAKLDLLSIPSVAVVHGVAFGGGMELAMACTFRLCGERARFALPEIKLGLIPGFGGTQRLPRLVGPARALEMIAGGRVVEATEAERIGLVNRVVDVADPVGAGLSYLAEFGDRFPASVMQAIKAVSGSLDLSLSYGLQTEADLFADASQTLDAQEGLAAFTEKRKAVFVGS